MVTLTKDQVTYWIQPAEYPVNQFVDHFLLVRGFPAFREERMFPSLHAELFFNLGDMPKGILHQSGEVATFKDVIISGIRSTFLRIYPGAYFCVAGMRFKLFGFYHLFGIPAHEFSNHNMAGTDVLGNTLLSVREQLLEASQVEEIFQILSGWVRGYISLSKVQDGQCWKKLEGRMGTMPTTVQSYFSQLTGYSHKHTIQLFKQKSGIAPKTLQKILRFNRLLQHSLHAAPTHWADLSYGAGYADQSHFIREFKAFTGYTPVRFLQDQPKDFLLRQQSR